MGHRARPRSVAIASRICDVSRATSPCARATGISIVSAKPVEEVEAAAGLDLNLKVAVRRGDEAHVDRNRLFSADLRIALSTTKQAHSASRATCRRLSKNRRASVRPL
jgi:hypothetical protein